MKGTVIINAGSAYLGSFNWMQENKNQSLIRVEPNWNSTAECVSYCVRRMCGKSFCLELEEACRLYPESADKLRETFSPIAALEKRLDETAEGIDRARFAFFFESHSTDETKVTLGSTLGALVLMPGGADRTNSDFKTYVDSLCSEPESETLVRMRCMLAVRNDGWFTDNNFDYNAFFDYVSNYPADDSWRLRILDGVRHRVDYAKELYEMLRPLEKILAEPQQCIKNAMDWFKAEYDGKPVLDFSLTADGGQPVTFEDSEVLTVTPSLFGVDSFRAISFQHVAGSSKADTPLTTYVDLMLLKNYISRNCRESIPYASLAACAKALSDPTRLRIVSMLRNEESYTQELSEKLGLSFTATSHHMTKLMSAGLVSCEKRGSYVYYKPIEKTAHWFFEKMGGILIE